MTSFRIEHLTFDNQAVAAWQPIDIAHSNWPVVYALNSAREIYIGETLDAAGRFRQHLGKPTMAPLRTIRVVIDDTFNKSVCLDLESFLIRLLAGEGHFQVLNANAGITDRNYYDRNRYQQLFGDIFDELRREGLFQRSIKDIENSDLFKLSPFKSLSEDQALVVLDIMEGLFDDLEAGRRHSIVIQGDPGTGKTIVGIFLIKLLRDIQTADLHDEFYTESVFSDFFLPDYASLLKDFRIGLVVPQQSLRDSIRKVFRQTPKLAQPMVLTPFDVGKSDEEWDLLIVDETHRLNQRANQSSGMRNRDFGLINQKLFGADDYSRTQLDWIEAKSRYQIYLLDSAQSVRPADLPPALVASLIDMAQADQRLYRLHSQMRVRAGSDYVGYVRGVLDGSVTVPQSFGDYDLRLYDDFAAMQHAIQRQDRRHGLARLVAGFAWPWASKRNKAAYDIELDGVRLRWNSTDKDWINSKGSLNEVGSIHTVQGYDLNYAGVIIGPDLRFDPVTGRTTFHRESYFDAKGKENNPRLGRTYTDQELLGFVRNIYSVLLTRGMRGTYVYAVDPALREHLRRFIPAAA